MAGIKDLKIRKSSFRFEVRRKYAHEQKYRAVEKTVLQKIKESLNSMAKPKGKIVIEDKGPHPLEQEGEKKPPSRPLVQGSVLLKAGGGVLLAILLLATLFVYSGSMVYAGEGTANPGGSPQVGTTVKEFDIITSSEEGLWRQPYHTAFVRLGLQGSGMDSIEVSAEVYDEAVPSSVYILRSYRYQAESYSEFISALEYNLSRLGIGVNEIGISELKDIPHQSLVIVPSGYIPQQMLYERGSRLTDLLDRGVTVMYIGQAFSRMYSVEGSVVSGSTLPLQPMALSFSEAASLSSEPGFNLKSPLYAVGGAELLHGSVSLFSYGTGAFIALPQTLDGGWENGTAAAEDVASLVFNMPWLSPSAADSAVIPLSGENETVHEFFTTSFKGDDKYVLIRGYSPEYDIGFSRVMYVHKSTNGEIYTDGHEVAPAGLGTTTMDIVSELKEGGGEEKLFLTVTGFSQELDRKPISTAKVPLNSEPTFQYTFSVPSGNYILNIVDSQDNVYARSYMRAGTLDIVEGGSSGDVYKFLFYADEGPIPVTGSVYVNDNPSRPLEFEDVSSVEIDAAELTGGPLTAGQEHSFTFTLGNYSITKTVTKPALQSIFTNPLILAALGIAAIALGIGVIFARQGVSLYGLDVPDFPPQTTKKIPMKKERLLRIFADINSRYKWKDTPLKLEEIKGGFKDILHEGKPVFISDYNLEYLLSRLMGMGAAKRELGYYGLSSWEEEAGRSVKYLAFFRKLRDICINNAIPFTPLGKAEGDYDSKITIIGQDIYVHLYDDAGRIIPDALSSLKNGLNIIIFEEEAQKSEFHEYLSSGHAGGSVLKLEIQSGSVLLKTWDEFAQMVKEMKV